jgi:hypothetical protein
MRLYIGLLHYPVYNKNKQTITSAITNFDLHDISRLAKTYGVKRFFVITPLEDQRMLAERIIQHWTLGHGAEYNPHRREALELVSICPSMEDAVERIEAAEGEAPLLIATDAGEHGHRPVGYTRAGEMLASGKTAILLFGTAWGIERGVLAQSDYVLEPIKGIGNYNHLSVRSAAAIILDRLVGAYSVPGR